MSTTTIEGLDTRAVLVAIVAHWTAQGGSKAELCRRVGVTPAHLSKVFHHDTHEPGGGLVQDIAEAAGVGIKVVLTFPARRVQGELG